MNSFIKGDSTKDGILFTWQNIENGSRSIEKNFFRDYLYIKISDFYEIKEELKEKWFNYIHHAEKIEAKNPENKNDIFAKITLSDNTKKHYINKWLLEEKGIQTFEGDLDTTKRYIIDNYKKLNLNLSNSRYLFYDIETDDRKNFKYDERNNIIPENTILSIAVTDFQGNQFFFLNKDSNNPECEREMLLELKDLFLKYSICSGWNSLVFDDVYISGRCKIHNIPDFMKDMNKLDFMFSYKKYRIEMSLDSYSLENVAQIELGEGKVDVKGGGGRLYKLYQTNKEKLKEYNIVDTELIYKLNKKLKFIELHQMTAQKGCCRIELTNYNIGSNDYFILMKCKDRNIIAPSNPTNEEKERRRNLGGIGGGYTRGVPGFYNWVATFDFSSLYPSLEITYNISPETFIMNATIESEKNLVKNKNIKVFKDYNELKKECKLNNWIHTPSDITYVEKQGKEIYHPYRLYTGENIGLLPSIMIELLEDRMRIKKGMKTLERNSVEYDVAYTEQLALKYMLNSNYGLNALPSYRFFKFDVADSITTSGRVNTKRIRKFAEDSGFEVVYSDTDSVGITISNNNREKSFEEIKEKFSKFNKDLVDFIDNTLRDTNNNIYKREDKYGIHNHRLILEWEKTFKTLLYKKKKRYAGLILYDNGDEVIDVTGLRSTQMNVLASKLQEEFIEDILKKGFDPVSWKNKMKKLKEDCFNLKIEADNLIISKKFTDRAINQKAPRAHTLLAERLISEGEEIYVGDKIKYIIKSTSPKQTAITEKEFNEIREYPPEYYWGIFINPLISLMSVLENIDVFDIIEIPELTKLNEKLSKERDITKMNKLKERLDKKKKDLMNYQINERETTDFLF